MPRLFFACACALAALGAPAAAGAAHGGGPRIVTFTAAGASSSCSASPGVHLSCGAEGGTVALALKVTGAVSCTLFRQPDASSSPVRWKTVACTSRVVRLRAPVPANSDGDALTVGFVLHAVARSGATVTRKVTISVAGAPSVDPPVTPAPQFEPVPALQPAWPFPSGSDGKSARNWAGYWVGGGPFTLVRGTFNVPNVTATSPGGVDVVEWVGIDGAENDSLIQAGVLETYDVATKNVVVSPWWEILPAPMTLVDGFSVGLGDQVTVVIWQLAGSTWVIDIHDDTNGQHFQTKQSYTGPATSAEWIVEAPTSDKGEQEIVGAFNPNVVFRNNRFNGTASVKVMVALEQQAFPAPIVIPSPMNPNDDFAVAFGGGGAITP